MDSNPTVVTFSRFAACLALGGIWGMISGAEEVLPKPTGAHTTGRVSFHWIDDARDELETSATDDKRELMVHVFYPADPNASGERAPYIPDADVMRGPWNEEQVARISAIRAHSLDRPALPPGDARYPVVVFAPGGGMKGLTYHALLEDLASYGWIVAVIDPPYNARAVRLPDGRVLGNLKPEEKGWPKPESEVEERRFYVERIAPWTRDISFVIDKLEALDQGEGQFAARLDLKRGVGVFGHSRGGNAAAAVRLIDERVCGGINIDGTAGEYPVLPVSGENESGSQPLLWIQTPLPTAPTDEQLHRAGRTRAEYDAEVARILDSWDRGLESVRGGAIRVHFNRPDTTHIDFSDEPFWDGTMTDAIRPSKIKTIADTRTWVRAFFDGTVRGDWNGLMGLVENAGVSRGDIAVRVYGKMWPEK